MAGSTRAGYAVLELGWEYNDEIYYHGEAGGGIPKGVYFNRELAQKKAIEETAKSIRGEELNNYGYNIDEVIAADRIVELSEVLDLHDEDEDDDDERDPRSMVERWFDRGAQIPKDFPLEKAIQVARCLEIEWFEVVEVEVQMD